MRLLPLSTLVTRLRWPPDELSRPRCPNVVHSQSAAFLLRHLAAGVKAETNSIVCCGETEKGSSCCQGFLLPTAFKPTPLGAQSTAPMQHSEAALLLPCVLLLAGFHAWLSVDGRPPEGAGSAELCCWMCKLIEKRSQVEPCMSVLGAGPRKRSSPGVPIVQSISRQQADRFLWPNLNTRTVRLLGTAVAALLATWPQPARLRGNAGLPDSESESEAPDVFCNIF